MIINTWINESFNLFGMTITWYAVFILIGVLFATYFGIKEGKKLGIASDSIYLGLVIILPLSILGARLWYVLFNLDKISTFSEFIGFDSNGNFKGLEGLAIQGGVIAALISIFFYCKKKGLSLYSILDIVAPGFLMGQISGRWGNFTNHELYGPIVQYPDFLDSIPILGDNMYIDGAWRHPVFLYESALNFVGLMVILVLRRKCKKLKSGDLMGVYLIWYGLVRCFTESLRLNSGKAEPLMFAGMPVSILISVLFIVVGSAYLIIKRMIGKQKLYQDILSEVALNKLDTILFDLDGTLLNTKPLIDASFVHTFAHFRPDYVLTDEELDSFFGPTLQQTFSKYSSNQEEIDKMIEYYREFNIPHHNDMVKIFPGVKDTIKTLSSKGYNLGVVSSKKTDLVKFGLQLFDIEKYMDVIIGANEVKNHKPAPDGILLAIEKIKEVNAEANRIFEEETKNDSKIVKTIKNIIRHPKKEVRNVAYVGDTLGDMKAGKAANVKTIGCLYIKHPEIMLEAMPDYVISKMSDLINICVE